ncbi:MAG: hypothetical protein DWQ01_22320 [Planctomycetota bacterium]|nr:MAG: hypothetical protein DWQ01_22320 [Planctomycetota bacterium]
MLAATPEALAQEPETTYQSIRTLVEAPARAISTPCPAARPYWGMYGEMSMRLGWEENFLFPEKERTLEEEQYEALLNAFDGASEDLNQRLQTILPGFVQLNYRLKLVDGNDHTLLLEGGEPIPCSTVRVFGEHERRMALVDFDVEIAQASFIADPITVPIVTGTTLAIQIDPVPDGNYQVQMVARHSEEGRNTPLPLGYTAMEGSSRNPVQFEEAGTVIHMKPGVATALRLPARGGRHMELDLEIQGGPGQQTDANLVYLPTLAHPPAGFLTPAPMGIHIPDEISEWEEQEDPELPGMEEAAEQVLQSDDLWESVAEIFQNGLMLVRGRHAPEVRDGLRAEAIRRSKACQFQMELVLIQEDKEQMLGTFKAPILYGVPTAFSAGKVQESVIDWDVEVAQGSRVADPLFTLVQEGLQGSFTVKPDAKGNPAYLDLSLEFSTLQGFRQHEIILDHAIGPFEGEIDLPYQPQDKVMVEEPSIRTMDLEDLYPLQGDHNGWHLRLRRSTTSLFGKGSQLEVRVSAK